MADYPNMPGQNNQQNNQNQYNQPRPQGTSPYGTPPSQNPRPYPQGQPTPNTQSQSPNVNSQSSKDESLRRLGQQLNKSPKKERKGGKIFIIILIVFLVALLGVAIWYFLQNRREVDTGNSIKISMDVTEEVEGSVGEITLTSAPINPGDQFTVICKARNANQFTGDSAEDETVPIYLRFSVILEVDGVQYYDLLLPNPASSNWHIYNPEEEAEGYVWDGYYYYYGKLNYNASVELFDTLTFDFEKIPNSFGNKSAVITIKIDAVEANIDIIGVNGGAWETAPQTWIDNMKAGQNNDKPPVKIEV